MRFAICNETFQGWDWSRTCQFVGGCGYDGIEIAPFTLAEDVRSLSAADRSGVRSAADANGLTITGLHWLLVSPKGLSVTTPDPIVRSETSDYLVALVDCCADLGGNVMVFGSPAQRRVAEGDTEEVASDRYAAAIRPALDRAADRGVVICLEPLPAPEANFMLTLEQAVAMIGRLDHPAARTIFDVKSACSEGVRLDELIRGSAPWISHVHANDANRRGPGFGETQFGPVLAALTEVGYTGFVSVEVFDYSPDPETIAVESLRHLRGAMPAVG